MSIDSSFNEPLEKLTNAVNERKISPSKPYKRHFIIHSIDFLQILNTIFNNNNNNNINNNNNNDSNNTQDIYQNNIDSIEDNNKNNNNNHNNNNNNNNNDINNQQSAGANMDEAFFEKKIKKIISRKNLSDLTKTELIADFVRSQKRKENILKERKLPSGSKILLGAGQNTNTHDHEQAMKKEDSSSSDDICSSEEDNRFFSKKQKDKKKNRSRSKGNSKHKTPVHNIEDNDDNKDDDDDDDDDDDNDNDEADDSTEDDDDSNNDAAPSLTPSHAAKKLIQSCQANKIPTEPKLKQRIANMTKRLTNFFSIPVEGNSLESACRRFVLETNGSIVYQHDTAEICMPINKLLASLTLPNTSLFRYLKATSPDRQVTPYTIKEKKLIKAFVRTSKMKLNSIPCLKLRLACKN